jgi:hypothetical protein
MREGKILTVFGMVVLLATFNPDKTFGIAVGVGIILVGLCGVFTKSEQPGKSEHNA